MNHPQTCRFAGICLAVLTLAASGCAPKLKAIEWPGQTVLDKGKSALVERQGLAVVVMPIRIRLHDDSLIPGFRIELINQSDRPVRMSYKDALLIGGDGMKRNPMAPEAFRRYAEMAQGDPPPPGYSYGPYMVSVGVGYGGWHYGPYYRYGPPYYYERRNALEEYYERREKIARFVSTLWKEATIDPGFVGSGQVVFDYALRKDDRVVLELYLERLETTEPSATTTGKSTASVTTREARPRSEPRVQSEPGTSVFRLAFGS